MSVKQRDKAESALEDAKRKAEFGKHLVRSEPCQRSRRYRMKVKKELSKTRRRVDKLALEVENEDA